MKTDTSKKIIKFIKKNKHATAHQLVEYLSISQRAVFKQLKNLINKKVIYKSGLPPIVYYYLTDEQQIGLEIKISMKIKRVIDDNYYLISSAGEIKQGWDGFAYWCNKNNQKVDKTADDYIKIIKKYGQFKKNGLINGLKKIQNTFKDVYLDQLYYLDFYSIERFGKTKLGQQLLYAKQSQNIKLIRELSHGIKPKIDDIIKKNKIDSVGFIPPTVKREIQFMRELEKNLALKSKTISLIKLKTPVIVPQKTLSKLNDRVENAQKTIIVEKIASCKNILLIDDAVGSGATLNETAKQIKDKNICKGKVVGLSITGSFRGFDIISEV
ncbi:MAG: hypothetical protein ACD_58C00214G0001 [uncultured bacterium]|nr:MAG: hypothetical protein ACD_58C00214G0001 [uncultured bacterium]